jgi:hypothetical protein
MCAQPHLLVEVQPARSPYIGSKPPNRTKYDLFVFELATWKRAELIEQLTEVHNSFSNLYPPFLGFAIKEYCHTDAVR